MNMYYMKDFKISSTLLVEDKKCYSGKFSFGERNQPENKEVWESFIKLSNFWKNRLSKMLFKRRKIHQVLKFIKLNNWLICIWISIGMTNKTLLLKISLMPVLQKLYKLLNHKVWKGELWISDVQLEELQFNWQAILIKLLESIYQMLLLELLTMF